MKGYNESDFLGRVFVFPRWIKVVEGLLEHDQAVLVGGWRLAPGRSARWIDAVIDAGTDGERCVVRETEREPTAGTGQKTRRGRLST
jgi:hypothetical protein